MEGMPQDGKAIEPELSRQRRMWKNFQEKTKPFLSPKLGYDRRGTDGKKETGMWMFKRKKQEVLDRVLSSSQPNLCCSAPLPPPLDGDKSLCSKPTPDCSKVQRLQQLGTARAETTVKAEMLGRGSPKPTLSHLVLSHHKSSSLGSTCFESLVMDGGGRGEEQLRKNASDSVS
ncbi:hypothetical protein SKAU_G00363250 [Synaphobranchus kaupii]|uniref:Uncharacterized protein n=1 Tax=Synaphobranchus kaupii TaxID=118154 RepID=A0A9Q1IHB8_SYNKA|nr:hypothetical protein SKAU_G00363250 [Synaphobranchus kaupii]